ILLGVLILGTLLLCSACHHKKNKTEESATITLNEESVTSFARNIVESIYNGNADIFNKSIDKNHIKSILSENSIVYSGFDVEGGQKYFENCLRVGDIALQTVNDGGTFAFVKYYKKDNQHHIIFRTYNDFIVNFADYIVDTVKGALMIKDGFIYNTGSMLSKNVEYSMLYNLMLQTNPESDIQWLQKAETLTQAGQHAQSLSILKAHKDALKEYPLYYQLYIANLYKTSSNNFDQQLDILKDEIDARYLLLHKLLYYTNGGKPEKTEETINALIPHSGDDPIYLLMYAKSQMIAGNYQDALTCLQTATESMPPFWDLWASELKCYSKLKDIPGYNDCLQRGKDAFGITDEEVKKMGI
ncbi:MAG: hypothetical protein MJZ57_05740, partial [Bacteroidales bacterium]|nr:hypothetical protein [Bacteroidales bacterium]